MSSRDELTEKHTLYCDGMDQRIILLYECFRRRCVDSLNMTPLPAPPLLFINDVPSLIRKVISANAVEKKRARGLIYIGLYSVYNYCSRK